MQEEDKSVWIKNTAGQPSMSATFAVIAFIVTTLAYVASIFQKVGIFNFRVFDPAAATAYLMPILGLYFGRRYTDTKLGNVGTQSEIQCDPPSLLQQKVKPADPDTGKS